MPEGVTPLQAIPPSGQPQGQGALQPPTPGQPPAGQPPAGQPPAGQPPAGRQRPRDQGQQQGAPGGRPDAFNVPGRPGYVPGGFDASREDVRDYDTVRRERREYDVDGRTYYREPGRIIMRDRDGYSIRHDENERFRSLDARAFRSERRGSETYGFADRPNGEQIITVTDDDGRLVRRVRRYRDGRELVIIDNRPSYGARPVIDDVVSLPPPVLRIPRSRYLVESEGADESTVYEAFTAPPVEAVQRSYSLDQVRNSPDLRARMPSVEINTVNFEFNSFTIAPDQQPRLSVIADAMKRVIQASPQEVFLVEGYTDAVGNDVDNLSLSDRRAQSVASLLTQRFGVPPENLATQGYGKQGLKVDTQGPSRENRRVVVRRVTPLIQQGSAQGGR